MKLVSGGCSPTRKYSGRSPRRDSAGAGARGRERERGLATPGRRQYFRDVDTHAPGPVMKKYERREKRTEMACPGRAALPPNKIVKHSWSGFPRFYLAIPSAAVAGGPDRFLAAPRATLSAQPPRSRSKRAGSRRAARPRRYQPSSRAAGKFDGEHLERNTVIRVSRSRSSTKLAISTVIVTWSDSAYHYTLSSAPHRRPGITETAAALYVLYKNNEQREILMMLLPCG